MKASLLAVLSATCLFGMTTSVFAKCATPTSFLSDSQSAVTSKYINFLICLHNEQQEIIAMQSDAIQRLSSEVRKLRNDHYNFQGSLADELEYIRTLINSSE